MLVCLPFRRRTVEEGGGMPPGANHRHYHVEADGRLSRRRYRYRRTAWGGGRQTVQGRTRKPLARRHWQHAGALRAPIVRKARPGAEGFANCRGVPAAMALLWTLPCPQRASLGASANPSHPGEPDRPVPMGGHALREHMGWSSHSDQDDQRTSPACSGHSVYHLR